MVILTLGLAYPVLLLFKPRPHRPTRLKAAVPYRSKNFQR